MILWSMASLASPCEEPVPVERFRGQVEAVWVRTVQESPKDAREDALATEAAIACLAEPLGREDAAAFHRNRAMVSLASEDRVGAEAAAAAARRLDPDGAAMWDAQSETFRALATEPVESEVEAFQTSLAARIHSDGTEGARRHIGQPVVLQVFAPDGTPLEGAWVAPRQPTPSWVVYPPLTCEGAVPVDRVVQSAVAAQRAFEALDVEVFVDELESVASQLPCADEIVTPEAAAAIHRLEGVRLFIQGSSTAAVRSFQEAQTLDPAFLPAEGSMPPGGSLARLWDRAGMASAPPWLPMEVPDDLTMWVDGLQTNLRPATLPTIVQVTDGDGKVVWTRFIPATVPLPPLGGIVVEEADPMATFSPAMAVYKEAELRERERVRRRGLRYAGYGALLASAGMVVVNASYSVSFNDPTLRPDRLLGRQRGVNASFVAGSALGAVGLGAIVAAEW